MNENKKIAINSIIIFVRLILTTIIGVYTSRVVLDALGASDYGLYNVVGGIVSLLNLLNTSMISTTYRFIAAELGKKEKGNLNSIFNTSRNIHICFAFCIVVIGLTIGEYYVNNILQVDDGKLGDALFIFHISVATAFLSTVLVPYQGLLVAYEKFNVTAIFDICSSIFKLVLIVLFVKTAPCPVRVYSLIMLVWIFIYSISFRLYSVRHYRSIIKYSLRQPHSLYKRMLTFAVWSLVGGIGSVGKTQGVAMILNSFFGTVVNAAYAIGGQVASFVTMFSNSLSQAAIPQITKSYSGNNEERSLSITCYISKFTFILMILVAFPIILEMDFLLSIWLKEVPEGASAFCKLIVFENLIWCLGAGIPALVNATGNIKKYQIYVYGFILIGLPVSILLFKLGAPAISIAWVYVVICFLSSLQKIFLIKKLYGFDVRQLLRISYTRMLYISIPLVVVYFFYPQSERTIYQHIICLFILELIVLMDVWILGLTKQERKLVLTIIKNKLHIC